MGVGRLNRISIKGTEFGTNDGVIAEAIVGLGRTIQQRDYALSARDESGRTGSPLLQMKIDFLSKIM